MCSNVDTETLVTDEMVARGADILYDWMDGQFLDRTPYNDAQKKIVRELMLYALRSVRFGYK